MQQLQAVHSQSSSLEEHHLPLPRHRAAALAVAVAVVAAGEQAVVVVVGAAAVEPHLEGQFRMFRGTTAWA